MTTCSEPHQKQQKGSQWELAQIFCQATEVFILPLQMNHGSCGFDFTNLLQRSNPMCLKCVLCMTPCHGAPEGCSFLFITGILLPTQPWKELQMQWWLEVVLLSLVPSELSARFQFPRCHGSGQAPKSSGRWHELTWALTPLIGASWILFSFFCPRQASYKLAWCSCRSREGTGTRRC